MRCGIFCATGTHSNLLMWAHYADRHRGAVLGFRTDVPDSILGQIKAVSYREERRFFYKDDAKCLEQALAKEDSDFAKEAYERLLLTKSPQWSYEQELRLVISNKVKADESDSFVAFHPSELVQMFLGCRVSPENSLRLARQARNLNPDIEIFSAKLVRRKYALAFQKIAAPKSPS